jgi:hypothetical protein
MEMETCNHLKVALLEEAAAKCLIEVEKAKERRREADKKKALDTEER